MSEKTIPRYELPDIQRCSRCLLMADGAWVKFEDVAPLLEELKELRDWKESALMAFSRWHELGDRLMRYVLMRLGEDIPEALAVRVSQHIMKLEAELARLRSTLPQGQD